MLLRLALGLAATVASCGEAMRPALVTPAAADEPAAPGRESCLDALAHTGAQFEPAAAEPSPAPLPGCGMIDGVVITRGPTGIVYQPAIRVSCAFALALGAIEAAIREVASEHLTEPILVVRTMGSFGCRMIESTRSPGRLSEHSFGNAIDVGELRGPAIRASVLRDFHEDTAEGRFLRALSRRLRDLAGLGRVLDPDYNAAHRNHFHLEGPPQSP